MKGEGLSFRPPRGRGHNGGGTPVGDESGLLGVVTGVIV